MLKGLDVLTIVLTGVSLNLAITHTAGHSGGFDLVVPRDAVRGTPQDYAKQLLDNTIAVLGRLTTIDQLIGEWASGR